MEVETLGVARSLGWRVHMRCAGGYREETQSIRKCVYRKQLNAKTIDFSFSCCSRARRALILRPFCLVLKRFKVLFVVADTAAQIIADPGHDAYLGTGVLSAPGLGNM
jgi:hypothetical protein